MQIYSNLYRNFYIAYKPLRFSSKNRKHCNCKLKFDLNKIIGFFFFASLKFAKSDLKG